ncbi:hypothetical protein FOZ63_000873, partial [Perkinsus olseni]
MLLIYYLSSSDSTATADDDEAGGVINSSGPEDSPAVLLYATTNIFNEETASPEASAELPRYIPLAIRHDEIEVSRHQRLLKTKFCRYGPNCEFARKGQCFYVHSPQELKYRPPKPQDYPYSRDRHDMGYYYPPPYGGSQQQQYDDEYDDYANSGYYHYDDHDNCVANGEERLPTGYPSKDSNCRAFSTAPDAGMDYYQGYAKEYYQNFTNAAAPRTTSTAASCTPASCSSPMLVDSSDALPSSEEPALKAMEIAIQIRDFARTSDRMLLLLQALSILSTSGDNSKTNKIDGLTDGTSSITSPLLTALAAFYATVTASPQTDGDHHEPAPSIPPGLFSPS